MKLGKLQLALLAFVSAGRKIAELEEELEDVRERRISREEFDEEELDRLGLLEFTLAEWKYYYEKELRLELEILKLKTEQTQFMLNRLLAD